MTYCTIAACPESGRIGVAIASQSIACGFAQVHVVAGVGALVRFGPRDAQTICTPLKLIELGLSPSSAIAQGAMGDLAGTASLIALVAGSGQTAVRTDPHAPVWSGHVEGPGFVAFGASLAGPRVVDAMAAAFAADHLDFEVRLLSALEAGNAAGGLVGPHGPISARSAALAVHGRGVHSELDLRVDLHPGAVEALRALYDFHKPYEAFYRLRSENPRQTPPQEAFMATLAAKPLEEKS